MRKIAEYAQPIRAGLLIVLMAGALTLRTAVGNGLRGGLTVCGTQLIPSLFPMMTLCGLFIRCGAAETVGWVWAPLMRRIGLPGAAGTVALTAMVGGYPVGAQGVYVLRRQGTLTDAQAAHMMRFCVCAGPGFAAMVGAQFGRPGWGALMYGAEVLSAVLLAICMRPRQTSEAVCVRIPQVSAPPRSFASALTDSVTAAAQAMCTLCAYVLLFAGIRGALADCVPNHPAVRLLGSLLEVTGGTETARALGSPVWAAFLLGFGGLCVLAQLRAAYPGRVPGFWAARILHGALTAAIFAGCRALFPQTGALPAAAPVIATGNNAFSAALLGLVAVFLLSIPEN